MLNLGGGELLAIGVIGLISLGPQQLPIVMRKLGAASAQMRSLKGDLEREFLAAAAVERHRPTDRAHPSPVDGHAETPPAPPLDPDRGEGAAVG